MLKRPDVQGAVPRPLTPVSPVGGGLRWAEPEFDRARGTVRCVLEEFTGERPGDVRRLMAEATTAAACTGSSQVVKNARLLRDVLG